MQFSTDYKRGWLRRAYTRSVAAPRTLLAQLELENDSLTDASSSGQFITSTAGNGHSVTFATSAATQTSPMDMVDLCSQMFDLYDAAVAELASEGNNAPTDLQIRNRMLAMLVPVFETYGDYSNLRAYPA